MERSVVLTRSRRLTAALITKYVNRANSLFTGAHAFHFRLSYRNSYSVLIFCNRCQFSVKVLLEYRLIIVEIQILEGVNGVNRLATKG